MHEGVDYSVSKISYGVPQGSVLANLCVFYKRYSSTAENLRISNRHNPAIFQIAVRLTILQLYDLNFA